MSRVNGGENASIRNALLYAIKAYCVNMAADTKKPPAFNLGNRCESLPDCR